MSNENKKDHHREKMEVSGQRKTQAQVAELRKAQAQAERKAVALSRWPTMAEQLMGQWSHNQQSQVARDGSGGVRIVTRQIC